MNILNLLSATVTDGAATSASATTNSSAVASASCLGGNWTMWIIVIVMGVLVVGMWLMSSIRMKKQQKEREDRMSNLAVGDKIVTIGMWMGEIVKINGDGTYVIKTGDETHVSFITIQETAIYQIMKKASDGVFEETVPTEETETAPATEESSDNPFIEEEEKKDEE